MNRKQYQQARAVIALFISVIVSAAVMNNSYLLAAAGVITGMLFMVLVRSKTKITIDEREKTVREKAALLTYVIFTPVLGLSSFVLTMAGRNNDTFSMLGQVLAYITLSLLALYSISFYVLNKRYGGGDEE